MAFSARRILAFALLLPSSFAWAQQTVIVTSTGLNVRTAGGAILCTVRNSEELVATGRDEEWLKVKVNVPGCPKEGFVHSGYVKPKAAASSATVTSAVVENEGLSFRNQPNLLEDSFECALPKGTTLTPSTEPAVTRGENVWIKVKIPANVEGCPTTGWVAKSYVKWQTVAGKAKPVNDLLALPRVTRRAVPDDVPDCNDAGCNRTKTDLAINQMNRISSGIGRKITDEGPPPRPPASIPLPATNSYLKALKTLIANPYSKKTPLHTNRGLVQIPLLGSRGNIAPCGSHHYLPDRPIGSDVYTNPLTACVFTSVLQQWRKTVCPNRSGCTIQFGDISDRTDPGFRGNHKSHTQGLCIDIRPPRKGGFEDSALYYYQRDYDRATARKLVALLKANGVNTNQLFFNDTVVGTKQMSGHENHIHACFTNNSVTRNVCKNLKVDPTVCPEIP